MTGATAEARAETEKKRETDRRASEAAVLKAKVGGSKSFMTLALREAENAISDSPSKPSNSQILSARFCRQFTPKVEEVTGISGGFR